MGVLNVRDRLSSLKRLEKRILSGEDVSEEDWRSVADGDARTHIESLAVAAAGGVHVPAAQEWLIRSLPGLLLAVPPRSILNDEGERRRLEGAWNDVLATRPTDADALVNAFNFSATWNYEMAKDAIGQALEVAPSSWSVRERAGIFEVWGADEGRAERTYQGAKDHLTAALKLARPPWNRFEAELAVASYLTGDREAADQLAHAAITDGSFNIDPNRHLGHTVLGLLCVQHGEVDAASEHLRNSQVPRLGWMGPSFRLAAELLGAGRVTDVSNYLSYASGCWSEGRERVIAWSAAIGRGERPRLANPGR